MHFWSTNSRSRLPHRFLPACVSLIAALAFTLAASRPAHGQTATTTTLAITSGGSAVTSVASGTVVTLTATVKAGSTPVTPGQVNFCDATATYCEDFHIIGAAQLTSSGTAVFKFRPNIGSHSYSAVFVGTKTNATSTSAASSLTVSGIHPSVTSLVGSTASAGQPLVASVFGMGLPSTIPTGTISFLNASNNNALLGSFVLAAPPAANGRTAFLPSATLPPVQYASNPVVADFNGDGIPDIAVSGTSGLEIFLGSANGTFTEVSNLITQNGSLTVGDFNGDGIPDLVVNTGTSVAIFLGNGNGTFTITATYLLNIYNFSALAVADFNHDGILDLVALTSDSTDSGSTDVTTLLGKGDGTFTTVASGLSMTNDSNTYVFFLASADFNGDGIPDIAITTGPSPDIGNYTLFSSKLSVYLGNGNGTFNTASSFFSALNGVATGIVAADFDGDGKPDIAAGTTQWVDTIYGSLSPVTVEFFSGDGNGALYEWTVNQQDPTIGSVYLGDFTGNGNPELLGESAVPPEPGVAGAILFTYDPTGHTLDESSQAIEPFSALSGSGYTIAADVNGDGTTDFATIASPGTAAQVTVDLNALLVSGTIPASDLPSGTYNVQASYSGDSNYAPSISPSITVGSTSTTLGLSVSPGSHLGAGQTATLTATLSPYSSSGNSTNGEYVEFFSGSTALGSRGLSNGVATFTTNPLSVGTSSYYAVYLGDYMFLGSTSGTVTITVAQNQPTLTLSASPTTNIYGQPTTLTATLSGYANLAGGETVTFLSGGQTIGTGTLFGDSATLTTSTLPAGTDTLTATYPGDASNGSATSNTIHYTVNALPPALTTPTPGSQLPGSTATFTWSPGNGVTNYQLYVGTNWPGGYNIYASPISSTATSATATGLPTDGVTVYVTLRYKIGGVWSSLNYTYTAAGQTAPPVLTSPAPGTQLSGSSVNFQWTPGSGVTLYRLNISSYGPGYFDLYGSGTITATSATASNLPTDGRTLYATLFYRIDGVWNSTNYTYTATGSVVPPALTSPTPGSQLSGSSVTFTWTPGSGVYAYQISAGTYGPGYFNIGGSPTLTTTSYTLPGIPTNGKPVYVTFRYEIADGIWKTIEYTYTAAP